MSAKCWARQWSSCSCWASSSCSSWSSVWSGSWLWNGALRGVDGCSRHSGLVCPTYCSVWDNTAIHVAIVHHCCKNKYNIMIMLIIIINNWDLGSFQRILADLKRKISINIGEARETSFLFQKISVLVQRFNAVLLHNSLPAADCTNWRSYPLLHCVVNNKAP